MTARVCDDCGLSPAKYFMIHPLWRKPVRVCPACEARLAEKVLTERWAARPGATPYREQVGSGSQGPAAA